MKANVSSRKKEDGFVDATQIISVAGILILIMAVLYAFFTTQNIIITQQEGYATSDARQGSRGMLNNTTDTGNTVFNIVLGVIAISAIMLLITIIMSAFGGRKR